MSITLEQLIRNRNDLIEAHRKNNFTDGIRALLTDLYPDTAHFIYELLQNAEDMNATVVRFRLDSSGIDFEHNGTKRTFNIADIDAITNIGHNSQKKDDPTSIGKFGVGFKAVFAYTATPIIHSGDYHFQIKNYFVPETQGVQEVSTKDAEGVSWTKFSFPFNNPKKPANTAFAECLEGLQTLDLTAILFLQNIKTIEYRLPNDEVRFVERIDEGNHHIYIKYQKPAERKEESSRWLRFSRLVNITDDQGKEKQLSIAVAFALEYDNRTKKERVIPVKGGGKTFIYFPAEKEHSGLRFHINAPFASTVARDSVRNCDENKKLIRSISQLVVDSLPEIKAQGLMNHAFFEVLPNSKDDMSFFYGFIFDYIYDAFQKNEYLPAKEDRFVAAKTALIGSAEISDLLKGSDIQQLAGIEKVWIKNAAQKNSNSDNFIHSLGIQVYSYQDFLKVFTVQCRNQTERLIGEKSNDWLKKFYILCADTYENADYSSRKTLLQNMKQTAFIKSAEGSFYKPEDVFILPPNTPRITKNTPVVEQTIVLGSVKSERSTERIKAFFMEILGVREYGPKIEVEKTLKEYEGGIKVNDKYFRDILSFAKYSTKYTDIDFSAKPLFLFLNGLNNDLYIEKAPNLYLGSAYGNKSGELLAEIYNSHCLWDGYMNHYNDSELKQFISFVRKCGIKKELEIVRQAARSNPLFRTELYSDRKVTSGGTSFDYTIPELPRLLEKKSKTISKLIWVCLKRNGKSYLHDYANARYAPNASAPTRTCNSTLIYLLKNNEWIPDKQGKMHKPEDISVSELYKNFVFDSESRLLEALNLGSCTEKQLQKLEKVKEMCAEAGMHPVNDEDFQILLNAKAYLEKRNNVAPLSGQELLQKQKKRSVPNMNYNDDVATNSAVHNIPCREINIEATFRNAKKMKPAQRQLFARVVESSKEERNILKYWYHGKCQMCNTRIMGYNQNPYFVAKNIISTQHLTTPIRQTTSLAWNSLCLCPNCAAKYNVCSRDLNGLYEQIMQTEVIEGDVEHIALTIVLDDRPQEIRYTPEHFLALKKVMQLIDEENK